MKFLYLFLFIFLFSSVSAGLDIGYNSEDIIDSVILNVPETPINYSLIPTVNSSDWWGSLNTVNTTQFDNLANVLNIDEGWLSSFGNALWCKLTGCTMTGDINMNGKDINNIKNANASGNITANDFIIPNMTGNNGIYSVNNWFINSGSPGQLIGGNISLGSGITVDVSSGTGLFRDADDDTAQLRSYMWDARSSITVPTNSIMYIGVDLNSGTPIIVNTTTDASWDLNY